MESSKSFKTYKKNEVIVGGYCKQGSEHFIIAHFNVFKVHEGSVGQFTGSVDRKGNEIYEGDIVLLDEGFYPRKRPVVFSEYGAWKIGELGILFGQMKADGFVHCEVIGNIYQNPELLERSEQADA